MPRFLVVIALLMLAAAFAAGNIWVAAARSTIPLHFDAIVTAKEVRHEKHPPKDDVCLLDFGPMGVFHVDQSIFDRVNVGERLQKEGWSRELRCNQHLLNLEWSHDALGMVWAMPLTLSLLLVLACVALSAFHIS